MPETEWNGSIDEALCITTRGWSTEDEHKVYLAAINCIARIARAAYDRQIPHCDKCGQRIPNA